MAYEGAKKCVCVCGGGGGGHTYTYIYVPSVNNQYKRDVIEYMVIQVMLIEIFHKIINWYMKMPNNSLSMLYKHIIQVENKNVGLMCVCVGGGGGANIPLPPNQKSGGGAHATLAPLHPPPLLPTPVINKMNK